MGRVGLTLIHFQKSSPVISFKCFGNVAKTFPKDGTTQSDVVSLPMNGSNINNDAIPDMT